MKVAVVASPADLAVQAYKEITSRYDVTEDFEHADVIVVLGGDGTMLRAIHSHMDSGVPLFGMNRGSVGFLLNDYNIENLQDRVAKAKLTEVHPLCAEITRLDGTQQTHLAVNDVSITRQSGQSAKLRIGINGETKLEELIGDGLIVSTPVGSTAYNRSAGGPILPLEAPILALTPICAFRPRQWKGAIIPDSLDVRVDVLEQDYRRVMIAVDSQEVRDVQTVSIRPAFDKKIRILSDPGRSWSDKILSEQFYG